MLLIEELRAEKKRLDHLISAVEIAARSPSHRLLCKLTSTFNGRRGRRRLSELQRRKKLELARLAGRVRNSIGL